jgi:hypothetical protein
MKITLAIIIWMLLKISAVKLGKEACKNGYMVFKGFQNVNPIFQTDPKLRKRKSAATKNYYTLLMSNLQAWKDFPPRDSSLICSTSLSYAKSYTSQSEPHIVFPYDNARFGISNVQDIWDANVISDSWNLYGLNLFFHRYGISDASYSDLINSLYYHFANKPYITDNGETLLNGMAIAKSIEDIEQVLENYFTPKNLGMQLGNIWDCGKGSFIPGQKSTGEVWTDSPAICVQWGSKILR